MKLVIALVISLMALWLATAQAQTPPPSPTVSPSPTSTPPGVTAPPTPSVAATPTPPTTGLRYRLQVFTGSALPSSDRPAPDGTRLEVSRLPDPRVQRPRPSGPCASGEVRGGFVDITVSFSEDCPPGERVGISLDFAGRLPITASSSPPLEWRAARPGEAQPIIAVVRPIPPNTGDAGLRSP
jgi:hypothetical protein